MEKKTFKLSVTELVNYAMVSGSLDSRFSTNASALEGIRLHKKLQKQHKESGKNYESEIYLTHNIEYEDYNLFIQGRADGIFREIDKVIVDEIKSTARELGDIEEEKKMHLAQAICYGYFLSIKENLPEIGIRITYISTHTELTRAFDYIYSKKELEDYFYKLLKVYEEKLIFKDKWEAKRNKSLAQLKFPFESYRKNQRELALTVYQGIKLNKNMYLQAPTGIGKTISTLFPSLKAIGENKAEKIFYLTSKTTIRKVAEETTQILRQKGGEIKSLTITAKDKICFMEKTKCEPDYCPYANGYFDRRNIALMDILEHENKLDRETIEIYSQKHQICPFEFSLDLVFDADVIICDYNYLFDPFVALKRLFTLDKNEKRDFVFLVDEAHNLPERGREMYSSTFEEEKLKEIKKLFKGKDKKVEGSLKKITTFINKLKKECLEEDVYISEELPKNMYEELRKFNKGVQDYLQENNQDEKTEKLLDFYFEIVRLVRIMEIFDDSFRFYIEKTKTIKFKLYCIDPSKFIQQSCDNGIATVFFSATLTPINYFTSLLGYKEGDILQSFETPFEKEKRKVMIAPDVATRFKKRDGSYYKIAEYINLMASKKTGNYMVFFPSYKYMNTVFEIYEQKYHKEEVIFRQTSEMREEEREEFLQKFKESPEKNHIGFCVLGGVFSEGIDLKGDRLIGVCIVGVGLPQVSLERNIILEFFKTKYDKGFEYAYKYPGMNKVLQGAGRLIRSRQDKGVILLLDERYMEVGYQTLLPLDYFPAKKVSNFSIQKELEEFWNEQN